MPSSSKSSLFQVESHSCYFKWVPLAEGVPEKAVSFTDANNTINIGRVKRGDHVVPGALRDGACRFQFEGSWHEERDQVEVMADNFGAAQHALSWGATEERLPKILLPYNAVVGGEFPGGVYIIGRMRGTMDIVPIPVKRENRNFDESNIVYEGEPLSDIEVLESEYHRMIAICPRAPTPQADDAPS